MRHFCLLVRAVVQSSSKATRGGSRIVGTLAANWQAQVTWSPLYFLGNNLVLIEVFGDHCSKLRGINQIAFGSRMPSQGLTCRSRSPLSVDPICNPHLKSSRVRSLTGLTTPFEDIPEVLVPIVVGGGSLNAWQEYVTWYTSRFTRAPNTA